MAKAFFKITLLNESDPQSQLITLTANPAGILDHEIIYKRHSVYGTMFRNLGDNLRFADTGKYIDGYDYLKDVFDNYGGDGICSIKIYTIVADTQDYELAYSGIIDFTTYDADDDYIQVGIIDDDIMAKFLAREDINVNVLDLKNIDDVAITNPMPSQLAVRLSPINPTYWANSENATANLAVAGGLSLDYNATVYPSGGTAQNYLGDDYDETKLQFTNTESTPKTINFKYEIETLLTGSIVVTELIHPPMPIVFTLDIHNGIGIITTYSVETTPLIGTTPLSFTSSIIDSISSELSNGETQGIYITINVSFGMGVTGYVVFDLQNDFPVYEMNYESEAIQAPSDCQSFRPIDIGNMILEQMGIDSVATPFLSSTLLQTGEEFEHILLTNGKKIRAAPKSTPLNISFRKFFNIYSKVLGGLLVYNDNSFKFEKIDYFYNKESLGILIDDISNVRYTIAEDKYFSKILSGYPDNEYGEVNGNLEFNSKFEHATRNSNVNSTKDLRADVGADSLGIETTRRMPWSTTGSEDGDRDNDLFLISSLWDSTAGHYRAELGSDFNSIVTELRSYEQYYNYRISPLNNLNRNSFYPLTSQNYLNNKNVVKVVSSKNSIELTIDGINQLEGILTDGNSLIPVYIEFDTYLTEDLKYFIKNSINNIVNINHNGITVSGFLEECNICLYSKKVHIKMIKA